jgi:type VI secretion system protein
LFERLEARDMRAATLRLDYGLLAASILATLNSLFNSRQGSCQTRPDYGLADFNDALTKGADHAPSIARAIKEQIERFEPRLTQVAVRPDSEDDDLMSLRFHISARLVGRDGERVVFETRLSDDGFVRVTR